MENRLEIVNSVRNHSNNENYRKTLITGVGALLLGGLCYLYSGDNKVDNLSLLGLGSSLSLLGLSAHYCKKDISDCMNRMEN
jgi:hypothetical protein